MDFPEVRPASNHALHRSEIGRWPTFPDLKPHSTLHALSCCTPLFAFPHLPQNDIPSKLRMGQDLLPHLSSSNTDRVNHALSVSANSPIWRSACNPLAHGMGHGTRRAQQFDERSNSLAPRDFFRRVSPGLWRSRWPGFATAPSPRSKRQPHTTLGRPQPFTVLVRCCLKPVFAATQSAPSTKKNPALIGPGSPFEMDSTEAYWAVVLTHETRKGAIGCGTAVLVGVVVTLAVGKNGGANPFANR